MCCNRITLEFDTLIPAMSDISIGGMQAPAAWGIEDICNNNPTYKLRYSDGAAGARTLNVEVDDNGIDLVVISGVGSPTPVTHTPKVVRGRPNDRF